MPLILPHGFLGKHGEPYYPASMNFTSLNGRLYRSNTSSTPTDLRRLTISMWIKPSGYPSQFDEFDPGVIFLGYHRNIPQIWEVAGLIYYPEEVGGYPDDMAFTHYWFDDGGGSGENGIYYDDVALPLNQWTHVHLQFDTTQTYRARWYINGVAYGGEKVNLTYNYQHVLFTAARSLTIGQYMTGKIAFIDVIDGQALPASAFAEDRGGVWTRIPYGGTYGAKGFSLDGSTGNLGDDVSGNGWNFSGSFGTSLDFNDLPPYVS